MLTPKDIPGDSAWRGPSLNPELGPEGHPQLRRPHCLGAGRGSPGQLLQFGLGVIQAVAFHVLMGRVGQELVQRQNVPGDLWASGERQGDGR